MLESLDIGKLGGLAKARLDAVNQMRATHLEWIRTYVGIIHLLPGYVEARWEKTRIGRTWPANAARA